MKQLRLSTIILALAIGSSFAYAQEDAPSMRILLNDGSAILRNVDQITDMKIETILAPTIRIGDHECVDLGLPSGRLWATCNLGASNPSEYGDFYSWGEVNLKEDYTYQLADWDGVSYDALLQDGVIGDDGNLSPQYDAATQNWGSQWRMPTLQDISELVEHANFQWGTYKGHFGTLVTGPNGNSIFLPAAGYRRAYKFYETIYYGFYWSATAINNYDSAYSLKFSGSAYENADDRYRGFSIRPVADSASEAAYAATDMEALTITSTDGEVSSFPTSQIVDISFPGEAPQTVTSDVDGHQCVDLGLPSGLLWADCNIGAETPEAYGSYYAWGELSTKNQYDIFKGSWNEIKYTQLQQEGVIDSDGNLTPDYDIATQLWGTSWRMPSVSEYRELIDNCLWTWVDNEERVGALITGPNGNSIFIPAAGNYHGFQGEMGTYWTASACSNDDASFIISFDHDSRYCTKDLRGLGIPIRPVTAPSR